MKQLTSFLLASLMCGCSATKAPVTDSAEKTGTGPSMPTYSELLNELSEKHSADVSWLEVFDSDNDFSSTFTFEFQESIESRMGKRILVVAQVLDIFRQRDQYFVHCEYPHNLLAGLSFFRPNIAFQIVVDRETARSIADEVHKRDDSFTHYFAFVVIPRRLALRYERKYELDEDSEITAEWIDPPSITVFGDCDGYEFIEYDVTDLAILEM